MRRLTSPVPRRAPRSRWERAFTLTEALIVLALISLLVVVASPTFVKLLRDRRVSRAAANIIDYFRTARTMAIGRGQPMLLSWNANGVLAASFTNTGTGAISIQEPIVTKNANATNCTTTAWGTATTQPMVNVIGGAASNGAFPGFDIQNGKYEYTALTFYDESGTVRTGADFCFAPNGRMYLRVGTAGNVTGAFSPVMGVPNFAVFNLDQNPGKALGAARWVYLLPNGTARMQL